jgi:hypothetical protein
MTKLRLAFKALVIVVIATAGSADGLEYRWEWRFYSGESATGTFEASAVDENGVLIIDCKQENDWFADTGSGLQFQGSGTMNALRLDESTGTFNLPPSIPADGSVGRLEVVVTYSCGLTPSDVFGGGEPYFVVFFTEGGPVARLKPRGLSSGQEISGDGTWHLSQVPDGGTTALLGLLAFGGLGFLRRFMK